MSRTAMGMSRSINIRGATIVGVVLTGWSHVTAVTWEYGPSLNTTRELHAVAKDGNGLIYTIGGSTQYPWDTTATVERFDEGTGVWSDVAELNVGRRQPCAATDAYGRVYAIGGGNAGGYLASVERYNDSLDEWEYVASMQEPHGSCGATTGPDGCIWVTGGGYYNNKVEIYDPDTDTWEYGPDLPAGRGSHASVTDCEGRIYVIGGVSEGGPSLSEVLRYDPANPGLGWTPIAPMPTARQLPAGVVDSKCRIWAIGGSGNTWVKGIVEIYDPETGEWSDGPSLQQPRNALGAVRSDLGDIYAVGGGKWTNPLNVVEFIGDQPTNCGDGILDPGEECDDGNNIDGDGCQGNCMNPVCGDGIVDPGEQCDGTDDSLCPGQCEADCTCPSVAPIPTLSEWGLLVMTLLLMTALKIKFGRGAAQA